MKVLSACLLVHAVAANSLVSTMQEFETKLENMRDKVLQYYKNCDYTCLSTSSRTNQDNECAIDACESSFYRHANPGVEETRMFGYPTECGNCQDQTVRFLDFGHSGVTNADISYKTRNAQERRELACWTSQLDADWIANRNQRTLTRQYFGTPLGLHRTYPGYAQETCSSYDPRLRSWYVAATTGPKDVVVIIDTSGSMGNEGRMALARDAAASVVGTLTILDRFNVIEFNSNSRSLVGTSTDEHKQQAIEQIKALTEGGGTNMENAFNRAFQLFEQAKTNEATTGCHKVILFLTDGDPSGGLEGSLLEQFIATKNDETETNAVIFTFWVEPYIDAFGAGEMTTAALAVYDNATQPATLLGVLGMDITVEEMMALEPNHEKFLEKFIQRSSPRCTTLKSLDTCTMEALRRKDYAKSNPGVEASQRHGYPTEFANCDDQPVRSLDFGHS